MSASAGPAAKSREEKHESTLKLVLSKLLQNAEFEELALHWFKQRKAVHNRECRRVDDRYERMGMDYREEQTDADIKTSFERLSALSSEPEKRQVVAELCEWLRYQSMPPRVHHLYPDELKAACQAAHFNKIADLADLINGFF
ncbi:hypothetical protein BOX15_Mlig013428g3 [Macrostomum lignano]|uniref:Uncharacterized protein n=1 Tax=Macrostomum lignano TaxID=282301 RepID=A0A267GQ01_9PLAT|nr:hypothetical protein BOX15_Mlig013428g3 [Macrostomum lignano]